MPGIFPAAANVSGLDCSSLSITSFDKEPIYEDVLTGIKGQYLIFKNNRVLNIRKHTGYSIEINY